MSPPAAARLLSPARWRAGAARWRQRFQVEKVLGVTEVKVFGGYCGRTGPIDGPYWTVSNIDAAKMQRNAVVFLPDLYEITKVEKQAGSSPNHYLKRIAIVDLKR